LTAKLIFFGGADEVTGSRHLLDTGSQRFLFDCGLFQGHRKEAIEKNRRFSFKVEDLDAVLLSHAHIDHSGALPLLAKTGFKKKIHCTIQTGELCRIMLMDSAHLQEEDAAFFNKIHAANGEKIEPLYNKDDVKETLKLIEVHPYDEFFALGEGVRAQFLNAGHVLGSAMIVVELDTPKGKRRILFTGDLGRRDALIMKPPEVPPNINYLIIESTYGNRTHEPTAKIEKELAEIVKKAAEEKGVILIPAFALERTQEVVFILEKLLTSQHIPKTHFYVDSPMAVEITEIFNKYIGDPSMSAKFKKYVAKEGDPYGIESIRYISDVEESKKLNDLPGHRIILSGAGMCEGGRILHHLRNNIEKDNTIILLVGYQAQGTLGRRLAEGADKVKIFGLKHDVRATVKVMDNFSSHADRNDLIWFIQKLDPRPRTVYLVHGDDESRLGLAEDLKAQGITRVVSPKPTEEHLLE